MDIINRIKETYCDLLCKIFGHRWGSLKGMEEEGYGEQYQYCFRCNLVRLLDYDNLQYIEIGKKQFKFFPFNDDFPFNIPQHWFLEILIHIKYFIIKCYEFPIKAHREVKWFIQRGLHGVSNGDCWEFDYYLCDIIIRGCKHLKKYKIGVPTCLGCDSEGNEIKSFEEAQKDYYDILDKIVRTFELHKKNLDCHDLTEKEQKELEEGWRLFEEYFHTLWS